MDLPGGEIPTSTQAPDEATVSGRSFTPVWNACPPGFLLQPGRPHIDFVLVKEGKYQAKASPGRPPNTESLPENVWCDYCVRTVTDYTAGPCEHCGVIVDRCSACKGREYHRRCSQFTGYECSRCGCGILREDAVRHFRELFQPVRDGFLATYRVSFILCPICNTKPADTGFVQVAGVMQMIPIPTDTYDDCTSDGSQEPDCIVEELDSDDSADKN